MKKILISILCVELLTSTCLFAKAEPFLFGQEESVFLGVNNRILAKVNDKPISVVDIMKKMDMVFYRQFPEYAPSIQARFQFYQINWKHILKELIDKELILADAEEVKLPISPGDVRQEMESLFGPSIIHNLDRMDLSYDEASKIILGDITIRRMIYYRVNSKAINMVSPQIVRDTYEVFAKENPRSNEWQYYVISIRDQDPQKGLETAKHIHELLNEQVPVEDLLTQMKAKEWIGEKTSVNLSEELHHGDKDLSDSYKKILMQLTPGSHSQPVEQKSRTDKSMVYRIFCLKDLKPGGLIPFNEMENKLRDKLIDEAVSKETDLYLKKLRQHFDVQESHWQEMLGEDFQPFFLK